MSLFTIRSPVILMFYFSLGVLYGTRLKYAAVAVNLSLTAGATYYREGLDIYERWEKLVRDEVSQIALFCKS